VRDYIHVVDLAKGHVKALQALEDKPQVLTVNLGTGNGYSVLDMVKAFEQASGKTVPYQIVDRRPGDIATCYADPTYAAQKLDWKAKYDLDEMCEDAWRWQLQNPDGYP
jgi:UDP-glucose 4-epimerase